MLLRIYAHDPVAYQRRDSLAECAMVFTADAIVPATPQLPCPWAAMPSGRDRHVKNP